MQNDSVICQGGRTTLSMRALSWQLTTGGLRNSDSSHWKGSAFQSWSPLRSTMRQLPASELLSAVGPTCLSLQRGKMLMSVIPLQSQNTTSDHRPPTLSLPSWYVPQYTGCKTASWTKIVVWGTLFKPTKANNSEFCEAYKEGISPKCWRWAQLCNLGLRSLRRQNC